MSTEMTQVPGAAAAQPNTQQPAAAQPATQQAPTLSAPTEPAPVAETSWLEDETMGLSNRTWCEIVGGITVAAAAYFVGQYVAGKSDDAPASV